MNRKKYRVYIEDLETNRRFAVETTGIGEHYAMNKVLLKYPEPRYHIYGIRCLVGEYKIKCFRTGKILRRNRYEDLTFDTWEEAEHFMQVRGMSYEQYAILEVVPSND